VTENWISRIQPLGLSFWYMDDGSMSGMLNIATHSFSLKEQKLLLKMLKKFGIIAKLQLDKKKKLWFIVINSLNRNKFFKIIQPYIVPSMEYKIKISEHEVICQICGRNFLALKKNVKICSSTQCHKELKKQLDKNPIRLEKNRIRAKKWREVPENRLKDIESSRLFRLRKKENNK
jgi:hypothetical protein